MKALNIPVILITLFFAGGIAAGFYTKTSPALLSIFGFAVASILILTYRQSSRSLLPKPYFAIAAAAFAFIVGMAAYILHYPLNHSGHYSHITNSNGNTIIKGHITERLKPNKFAEKYFYEVATINGKAATGKLLIIQNKDSLIALFHAGDVVVIAGELKPVNRPLNPYQFNYAAYMERQGVFHQVNLKKENYVITGQEEGLNYYTERIRDELIKSFSIHNFSPATLNVLKALLLGQRQDIDKQINDNYIDAGVIHILAISGLHIAVLFYMLNVFLKPLYRLKHGRFIKLIAILLFLWLFAFVSGLSASVVRSVVMFSFVSIGLYMNRSAGMANSIAVSMLALLIFQPNFLFDTGFQLSYAAVFVIVAFQPIYKKLPRSRYKAVNFVTDTILISLAAQIGVLPLSLYCFNQFPLLFLAANVIVIPLSNLILVLGIVVLTLNFVWAQAAVVLGVLLESIIGIMNSFIEWLASFTDLVLKDIPFNAVLALSLSAIIVAGMAWLYKKSYKRTMMLLSSVLIFQVLFAATRSKVSHLNELVVLHDRKSSLIALKHNQRLSVYSSDSLAVGSRTISSYARGSFSDSTRLLPLRNVFYQNGKKVLVINHEDVINISTNPDVIVLAHSPKINLERLIKNMQPAVIIADGTNYKNYVARWKATCMKQKIPFHATAEKGFYTVE